MKALGLVVSVKNLFIDPVTYLCGQLDWFKKTLIGDHPGIIPVKFGQIPISG